MICRGTNVSTGERIDVEGDAVITHINPVLDGSADDGVFVAPGFIDLQVNGFAGVDYNSPEVSREEIERSLKAMAATGVTRSLPTVITGAPERMLGALRNLAGVATIEGFHVEGPHISAEDDPRGAHPKEWVRKPDINEYRRWQDATDGRIKLVTLAPEWPEVPAYIEALTREGVVVAIGHTRASKQQILDAVSAGATLSTHLGNGTDSLLHKSDNYIWDQLGEDRLAASFIVDRHHLPDAFLRIALRAKGVERSVLVTDAVAPAGCAPGAYKLGDLDVDLKEDGRVVLRGSDRLAGSSLTMDRAISNAMSIVGLREAVAMAASNAARIGRVRGRLRGLQPGERADVVRFRVENDRLQILATWISGESAF